MHVPVHLIHTNWEENLNMNYYENGLNQHFVNNFQIKTEDKQVKKSREYFSKHLKKIIMQFKVIYIVSSNMRPSKKKSK